MAPSTHIYLARTSYRQRRFRDAAKVLPIVGFLLWVLPLMSATGQTTGASGLYLFSVWMILIILSAIVSTRLRRDDANYADDEAVDDPLAQPATTRDP